MTEESTACSAREVLEEFNKSSVRVAWPRLADLLDVPPEMQHRIQRLHEYKLDPALLVKEEESLRQVLSYWENNDPNHTWETLSLALMSDRIYKELGASLYFKHVKPEEFTLDKVYEEVKEITNPREIAYVLTQDSKKLREIWGENADELTPEERAKLAINHWMTSHPEASWMLLAKHIEWFIHGEHEAAAQKIATTIREKYLPKVEEKMGFGVPKESEERKFPEKFGANAAFQQLTAVEDWFGLGWFLEIEEEELKQIEKEHGRDDDRKLAMLKLWVELNPKSASWNSLTTAVRKMPQHQSLAEDIQENFLEQERRQIIQKEQDERSKELYNQFFRPLFESLCNEQVCSSLIDQLVSMSLISEADKETLLSSTQHPKVRATSLLEVLNIEEKPHLLMELIKAMEEVEVLKGLADEMLTQFKANEGGGDAVIKIERQLSGVNIAAEQVFKVQGESAQSLLWKEHGFRMHIPQDALLPNETCHVSVKAIVAGLFQFPEGTERVSAVYAISSTQQFHKPVMTELQHCVQLDSSEQGKYMSIAVAQLDPSSTHCHFQLSEGTFQPNSYFGTFKENQFFSLATCIIKNNSTVKCPSDSGRQHQEKSEGDEEAEEAEKLEGSNEPESKRPKLDIETSVDTKVSDISSHKSVLPGPTVYNAMTFYQKQNLPYTWIVAVAKKYNTMEEHVKKYFKDAEFDMKMVFSFEKEGKEDEGSLLLVMEPHTTPSGWNIQPQLHPCKIDKIDVEKQDCLADESLECHPVFQKVEVTIADWSNPPTSTLAQSVPMLGIKYPNVTSLSFMFEPPANTGQLTGVKVVDEKIFIVKGGRAQPLLWKEHSFGMYIPKDALSPNETCFVTVKAVVGGLFQFPEGTKPVSAVYAISLSKQLRKPARMEMQHCVKLKNPEDSKFLSFAVASQSPSSMPYQFQEVSDGIFEKNSFFGSVNRQQFSFMTIIWKLLGYNDAIQYIASTFIEKVEIGKQLWILAVSEDIDTMKRYLKSSLKKAKLEVEQLTFEFDKEKLTLKIIEKAAPGWIIEPLVDPCTITRKDVEHGPALCKVRIAFEETTKPPKTAFRNRIRLDGAEPEHYFTIHLNQTELVRSDSDASNSYLRLLSSSSSMDSPLDNPATQSEFYKMVIMKIPAQWRMFGIMLDIEHGNLEGILRDERNCQNCFLVVYQIGKREFGERFTWRKILKILEDIGEKTLCKTLHKKLTSEQL